MPLNNPKPIIYLAFANDNSGKEDYLKALAKESAAISAKLQNAVDAGLCTLHVEPDATAEDIFAFFGKPENKNRIAIFHYGGHASGRGLHLNSEDDIANKLANAGGLAQLFATQPELQLVFLNGCSTLEQGQNLLDAGVKNVVVTSTAISDEMAVRVAEQFYQSLAGNHTIAEAMHTAEAYATTAKGTDAREFYFDRGFVIEEMEGTPPDAYPWKLMSKSEGDAGWKLTKGGAVFGEQPEMGVFVAYSQADQAEKDELVKHLVMLKRRKLIKTLSIDEIIPGEEIGKETKQHMLNARIILLLVSTNFLNDCYELELYAMERYKEGASVVVPVFLKPAYNLDLAEFTKLQGLPRHYQYKFVADFKSKDEGFANVAAGVREVVEALLPQRN